MASSPNIRIPIEDHETAEKIAVKMTAKKQQVISKNEVLKEAVKIGLKELNKKYAGNNK